MEITKEDREAAADSSPNNERWGMLVRAGYIDSDPLVQAFAAHRIAAEQAVLAKLRDRMDEDWFDEIIQDSFDMDWTSRDGARAIIRAIDGVLGEKS